MSVIILFIKSILLTIAGLYMLGAQTGFLIRIQFENQHESL